MHKLLAKFRKDGDRDKHSSGGTSSDEEYSKEEEKEQSEESEVDSLGSDLDELRLDSKYSSLDMFEKKVILGTYL